MRTLLRITIGLNCFVAAGAATGSDSLALREQAALKAAAAAVEKSVVQIRTVGGLEQLDRVLFGHGATTGVIVSPSGFIISSAFHFAQRPTSILVTLADGRQLPAELVARDHSRMLVLLKIDAVQLPVAPTASAEEMRVGQWAIAVGRAYRADRVNISVGIVSALERLHGKAIQTDAKSSPANYGGPLVDIQGRVTGILVPMSPQTSSQVAGVSWYDSGIAFAVPMDDLLARLPAMMEGHDQHPGRLGITLIAGEPHSAKPEIKHVRAGSPADRAGLRAGDLVTKVEDVAIATQMHLLRRLRPLYAGDQIRLNVARGDTEHVVSAELLAKLPPFQRGFLGILPMRGGEQGITVRHIFAESAAATADLRPGDRLLRIDDVDVASVADGLSAFNAHTSGESVRIEFRRGEKNYVVTTRLTAMSDAIPGDLPPATPPPEVEDAAKSDPSDARFTPGIEPFPLAPFENDCRVSIPASVAQLESLGLLVWLRGERDTEESTLKEWQTVADRDGLIVAAPSPADDARWFSSDLRYLRALLERLLVRYPIDPHRVVVAGESSGGVVACQLGLMTRQVVRGVGVLDSPLPTLQTPPQAQPTQRFALYVQWTPTSPIAPLVSRQLRDWSRGGIPLAVYQGAAPDAPWEALARWIDSLDRM